MTDIIICGHKFNRDLRHFSFEWPFSEINDMNELSKLTSFPNLTFASFSATNLNDFGLQLVSHCETIDNLDLQDTEITNQGILHLKNLKNLKYLRLKENVQIDNSCISSLNQCDKLIDLQIHETSITEYGLKRLNIPSLKDLILSIEEGNYSYDFLKKYSMDQPKCNILVKGKGQFFNGNFEGEWDS